MQHFGTSLLLALALTAASYALGLQQGWISSVDWLEAFSVFTSYSCTYLCVKQSRLNYPIGAVSTVALTILFWRQGLYSSAALNAYLVPALAYGWWRWGPDQDTRPVTRLTWDAWTAGYGLLTIGTYIALNAVTDFMGATLSAADSAILILSILAQFLLDNKKLETWAVWVAVNLIAIVTYWQAGLIIVAIQFVFFLANAVLGFVSWRRSYAHGA